MLARYRVHEISSRDALTPGLSVLRTKVFRSLIACKTFYHQTCAKTSPILLFWHGQAPSRNLSCLGHNYSRCYYLVLPTTGRGSIQHTWHSGGPQPSLLLL